jgi:hypothetical protein
VYAGVVAAYASLGLPAVPHYHAILYPIVPVFVVWFLDRALGVLGRSGRALSTALVVAIAGSNAVWMNSFYEFLRRDPTLDADYGGHYGQPLWVTREHWTRKLATDLEQVRFGSENRRAEQAELGLLFDASTEVLLRFDARANLPAAEPHGDLRLEPSPDGLSVSGGTPTRMLRLPLFETPEDSAVLLELDLTVPATTDLVVFYPTSDEPGPSRRHMLKTEVPEGRSVCFLELPDPALEGRLLLRMSLYRYVVHALEARAITRRAPRNPRPARGAGNPDTPAAGAAPRARRARSGP